MHSHNTLRNILVIVHYDNNVILEQRFIPTTDVDDIYTIIEPLVDGQFTLAIDNDGDDLFLSPGLQLDQCSDDIRDTLTMCVHQWNGKLL